MWSWQALHSMSRSHLLDLHLGLITHDRTMLADKFS